MTSFFIPLTATWWQMLPHKISPIFLQFGNFEIRYYGLMFVLSILGAYAVSRFLIKKENYPYSIKQIDDFYFWVIIGVILGGRLGYVLFYNLNYYLKYPLEIFLPFDTQNNFEYTGIGGMSYHGGLIGSILAAFLFAKKEKLKIMKFMDFITLGVPAGYTFGRIGNFLNGELFGRPTEVPWGMYFPSDFLGTLRHPSQLYEALFEGIVLFFILWQFRNKKPFDGFILALYLILYGVARFGIEYTREPDRHLGFIIGSFTMGQALCFFMIAFGAGLLAWGCNRKTDVVSDGDRLGSQT